MITSRTSADTHLSPGRRPGSSSRMRFLKAIEGWMSCSGPEVSASLPDIGIQLAKPALVPRSLRLSGGLFRMSRSELRLTSSSLFCDWPERSSGLFHTPSVICLYKQKKEKKKKTTIYIHKTPGNYEKTMIKHTIKKRVWLLWNLFFI